MDDASPLFQDDSAKRDTLIFNDSDRDIKVVKTINDELCYCDTFDFSVAFITSNGLAGLKQTLINKKDRIKGRIITTDYLNFNEPKALRELLEFKNIEVRVYTKQEFHTKGYIFSRSNESVVIIGSSNLTDKALSTNKEWNIRVTTQHDPLFVESAKKEFNRMWDESDELTEEWIQAYKPRYERSKFEREQHLYLERLISHPIHPNEVQEKALNALSNLRSRGKHRAIIVSATGTGKTYLSAFDVRNTGYRKILFLVHREQILNDAMTSYRNVLDLCLTYGKITGSSKDYRADVIFSTTQSMSREEIRKHFAPDHFEYIVCDEAHHATSPGYRSIIDYFKPKFMLGMTATPERMDGDDIFKLFDYNVACEIRLQDALRLELVCPFHYYGIADITIDGKPIDEHSGFNELTSEERVRHIIEKAQEYGHCGDRVKGLIFCNSVKEGREISNKINTTGKYRTQFVCGDDDVDVRELASYRLEQDESDNALDYVVTVDVFNEGVDIRSVNQIILLRETESATIFIQQLGRGLRKKNNDGSDKEYLVVLDFIGNYTKNFLIPVALTGDNSMNKRTIKRKLTTASSIIPGCSTVDFDPVSKKQIFKLIDVATNELKELTKEAYLKLAEELGFAPNFEYLLNNDTIDPEAIVENYENMNRFRMKLKLEHIDLQPAQDRALTFVSQLSTIDNIRPHELLILSVILEQGVLDFESFEEVITSYGISCERRSYDSAINVLSGKFDKKPENGLILIEDPSDKNSKILPSATFKECCDNPQIREYFKDVIRCGLDKFKKEFLKTYDGLFVRYKEYDAADVCRVLNWAKGHGNTMGGHRVKDNECPLLVTYHKDENTKENQQYMDEFVDKETFDWMSKSNRKLTHPSIKDLISPQCQHYLFIGKKAKEKYYYIGKVEPLPETIKPATIGNQKLPIVTIRFKLEKPVSTEFFNFITEKDSDLTKS